MYELKESDRIFIYTGPEGSGRKTVADLAGATFSMKKVLAYTTRARRANESEGQYYHHISHEEFEAAEANGEFLEIVKIHTNLYGIKKNDVERHLASHGSIYLVLNRQGAEMMKEIYGDQAIRFFIYADQDTVKKRQQERGLAEDVIERNLIKFNEDMAYMSACEHAFENYDLSYAMMDLTRTIEGYLQRDLLDLD